MEKSWEIISSMLESVIDEKFQVGPLKNSPYPLLGDDNNKVYSAFAEDLKTIGYGRTESRNYPTYNNTFDPRLCFQGIEDCIFEHAVKEDNNLANARLTENVFLALDNPSAIMDDYLYGYKEYLKNLTSLPTIYMGPEDDTGGTVKDDGSEECKRLFQRIRSQSVKAMFPKENNAKNCPNSNGLPEKINSEYKSSIPHTQHHNQSDKIDTEQICLSPSATHNNEKVFTKICKGADDKRTNDCHFISNELAETPQILSDLSSSGSENMFAVETTTVKVGPFIEDSKEKILSQNSPTQTTNASSKNGRPFLQKEIDKLSYKSLQEAMVENRLGKMYGDEPPDSHLPVQKPKVEKRRQQLKAKKLKDLSEKQHLQPVAGEKGTHTSKDSCTLNNASWAEKLFHNVANEKEDSKERKLGNNKALKKENTTTTVTSNLRPTSEPFTPPSFSAKSNNNLQTQSTTPCPLEDFQQRHYCQNLTTHAQSNNFLSGVQPAPYQQLPPPQSVYNVPTNMPPPLVHNWAQFNAHQNYSRPQEIFQNTKWFNDNSIHPVDYQQPLELKPVDEFVASVMQNNRTCGQNYGYNQVSLYPVENVLQSHNPTANVPPQYTFSQHRFPRSIYQQNDPPRQLYGFREFRNSSPYNYKNNSFDDNNNNNNNINSSATNVDNNCPEVGRNIPRIQFRRSRSCEELDLESSRAKHKPRAIRANLIRIYPNDG